MRHLRQVFSAPSRPMPGSNPEDDLNSIASISASSTISTPSSEPSASKPRDSAPKREQNPRYKHDNGLRNPIQWSYRWGPLQITIRNTRPKQLTKRNSQRSESFQQS